MIVARGVVGVSLREGVLAFIQGSGPVPVSAGGTLPYVRVSESKSSGYAILDPSQARFPGRQTGSQEQMTRAHV